MALWIVSAQFSHARALQWSSLGLVLLVGVGFWVARWRSLVSPPKSLLQWLFAWVLISGLSCIWSLHPGASLISFGEVVVLPALLFYVAFNAARIPNTANVGFYAAVTGSATIATAAIMAYAFGLFDFVMGALPAGPAFVIPLRWYPGPGLASTFLLFTVALIVPGLLWMDRAGFGKYWLPAILILVLVGGGLTFNRMFWPSLVLVLAVAGALRSVLSSSKLHWKHLAALLVALIISISALAAVSLARTAAIRGNAEDALHLAAAETLKDPRIVIWRYWSEIALRAPIFGHGLGKEAVRGANDHTHPLYAKLVHQGTDHPHNVLLGVWLQLGVTGALCFIGLLSSVVNFGIKRMREARCIRTKRLAASIVLLTAALLVKNMTDDFYDRVVATLYWTYVGLLGGALVYQRDNSQLTT